MESHPIGLGAAFNHKPLPLLELYCHMPNTMLILNLVHWGWTSNLSWSFLAATRLLFDWYDPQTCPASLMWVLWDCLQLVEWLPALSPWASSSPSFAGQLFHADIWHARRLPAHYEWWLHRFHILNSVEAKKFQQQVENTSCTRNQCQQSACVSLQMLMQECIHTDRQAAASDFTTYSAGKQDPTSVSFLPCE